MTTETPFQCTNRSVQLVCVFLTVGVKKSCHKCSKQIEHPEILRFVFFSSVQAAGLWGSCNSVLFLLVCVF